MISATRGAGVPRWARRAAWALLIGAASGAPGAAAAEVAFSPLFGHHAVVQRSAATVIRGSADAGETVAVSLAGREARAIADERGRWQATLNLADVDAGPHELEARGPDAVARSTDVLVGEVWLASGQSNMEWTLGQSRYTEAADPSVRQFLVKKRTAFNPAGETDGSWASATGTAAANFSAIGYFFAQEVRNGTGRPVGLLNASWGGTSLEAWTGVHMLADLPEMEREARAQRADAEGFPGRLKDYAARHRAWASQWKRTDAGPRDTARFLGDEALSRYDLPRRLPLPRGPDGAATAKLPPAGAVWWRRQIEVRPEWAGIGLFLELGRIDGFWTAYLNGEKVAEATADSGAVRQARAYVRMRPAQPGGKVAELAVRIFNPVGAPVIREGAPLRFDREELGGGWRALVENTLPAPSAAELETRPEAPLRPPAPHVIPGSLYDGMIAPLVGCSLRGVIWYQGENNVGQAARYREAFPRMIQGWRQAWKDQRLPFLFCQLANFKAKPDRPGESGWAELREAQASALALPATGQAVLIDAGEAGDIHPRDKRLPGQRLAKLALATVYQVSGYDPSGPVFESLRIEGGVARLRFRHIGGGLVAAPLPASYRPRSTLEEKLPLIRRSRGPLEGFAICGSDRRWVWAEARIAGDEVLVWSDAVPAPVAVRYAWADNPTCNLYNADGLPTAPFRTDGDASGRR